MYATMQSSKIINRHRCNNIIDADNCSISVMLAARTSMRQMWSVDMWHMRRCGCSHPPPAIRVAVMPPDGHAVRNTYAMEILNATAMF